MFDPSLRKSLLWCISTCLLASIGGEAAFAQATIDISSVVPSSDQESSGAKIDSDLRTLVNQFSATTRGGGTAGFKYNGDQLKEFFGIGDDKSNPIVELGITADKDLSEKNLEQAGARVRYRLDDVIYASAPVSTVPNISKLFEVKAIDVLTTVQLPSPPKIGELTARTGGDTRGDTRGVKVKTIDRLGRSGRGVIVGVVDTGIDWTHPDFIRSNGTTRILYLYDLFDNSWKESGGKIGLRPPAMMDKDGQPTGTVYTYKHINQALASMKDGSTVNPVQINSYDECGHGTACAGMAAGNGRAGSGDNMGVPMGTYPGLAVEADLIIVKASRSVVENGRSNQEFHELCAHSVKFITDKAREMKRPCAINISWGSHNGGHDGTFIEDRLMDGLCGPGRPGVVICAAAGNERQDLFHAGGRFGPIRQGQVDAESNVEFEVLSKESMINVYFDPRDNWELTISGSRKFKDPNTGQILDRLTVQKSDAATMNKKANRAIVKATLKWKERLFQIMLPQGKYKLNVGGLDSKVVGGRFDVYARATSEIRFTKGVDTRCLINTPGTSKNVITVGAYDDVSEWKNLLGTTTYSNLTDGEISEYSCPGYRRDGVIKPEIAAPGTYAISSLARLPGGKYCDMGQSKLTVTQDGYHVAWPGTSVATPFVTGVAALLLERNYNLDCSQIKSVICRTAKVDASTSGVPNRDFGYGKIDPTAAIRSCDQIIIGSQN